MFGSINDIEVRDIEIIVVMNVIACKPTPTQIRNIGMEWLNTSTGNIEMSQTKSVPESRVSPKTRGCGEEEGKKKGKFHFT